MPLSHFHYNTCIHDHDDFTLFSFTMISIADKKNNAMYCEICSRLDDEKCIQHVAYLISTYKNIPLSHFHYNKCIHDGFALFSFAMNNIADKKKKRIKLYSTSLNLISYNDFVFYLFLTLFLSSSFVYMWIFKH